MIRSTNATSLADEEVRPSLVVDERAARLAVAHGLSYGMVKAFLDRHGAARAASPPRLVAPVASWLGWEEALS